MNDETFNISTFLRRKLIHMSRLLSLFLIASSAASSFVLSSHNLDPRDESFSAGAFASYMVSFGWGMMSWRLHRPLHRHLILITSWAASASFSAGVVSLSSSYVWGRGRLVSFRSAASSCSSFLDTDLPMFISWTASTFSAVAPASSTSTSDWGVQCSWPAIIRELCSTVHQSPPI